MTPDELKEVYYSRPFKTRNADEYDLENILDLFIDPTDGLIGPFEFSNSIIKGKMGSGKTMYLRANYAYYLYTLVPGLINGDKIVLPVYIKLSDFQNIHDAKKLYDAIIIRIIEEIVAVCEHLRSADELARLHIGASTLLGLWPASDDFSEIRKKLECLSAEGYVQTVSRSFETTGSASSKFLEASAAYKQNVVDEIKRNDEPRFQDVVDACKKLLAPFNGKLLILLDEIGSISKSFFKSDESGDSYFETLMNQLRTLSYVRTKLAVYPHSYSDILKETRYGDVVELECDVVNNDQQFHSFMSKTVSLVERYIEKASGIKCNMEDVFAISVDDQLLVEQLINASEGNMRRLVHLVDSSMNVAYENNHGEDRVSVDDVWESLRRQGAEMESQYGDSDKDFLDRLARICRSRSTYRFSFPNKSTYIGRYSTLSEEYNIVEIRQAGVGRKGTVYCFDYAYCVYKEIPTHYVKGSERIDKRRSNSSGEYIKRIAQLSDELLLQTEIRGKIEASIAVVAEDGNAAFATDSEGNSYFVSRSNLIKPDRQKELRMNGRIYFVPTKMNSDTIMATEIEIL